MLEAGAMAEEEAVLECQELEDASAPLRQGDVLEWLNDSGDPLRRFAIVVTADCDLAHRKHSGMLACVPVIEHERYLALFTLSARLEKAKGKLLEAGTALIRRFQEANRPEFPIGMSDSAIFEWIDAVGPDEIVKELRVSEEKEARRLIELTTAIRTCSGAAADGGFDTQLDALASAWLVTQAKSGFTERRQVLARDVLSTLNNLPGDAVFLHGLSPQYRLGYVVYLRAILNVDERAVARRVTDLRDSTVAAKRIARLTSPYVFHLSQALGHVFSAIGLPAHYEASREAFINRRADVYGADA
jgi:hypothetical protein